MSDFHTSLNAALRGEPRWAEPEPANPSFNGNPADYCDCGSRIVGDRGDAHPCPICTDDRSAA